MKNLIINQGFLFPQVSESPLSILYNHSLPPFLVHDWYEYIALEYLEDSVGSLLSQWETECKVCSTITIPLNHSTETNIEYYL